MSKTYNDFAVWSHWLLKDGERKWDDLATYFPSSRVKIRIVFFLLNFLLGAGYVCGFFASHALMLSHAGSSYLFHAYVLSALLALALSGFFYLLADFLSSRKLFGSTFLFLGVLVLASWAVLKGNPEHIWVYIGVRCLFYAVFVCVSLWFWLVVSLFCSNTDSKVLFPYFVAAEFLGMTVGGLFISFAASKVHSVNLVLIWGVILTVVPPVLISGVLGNRPPADDEKNPHPPAPPSPRSSWTGLTVLLFFFWLSYSFFAHGTDYVFNLVSLEALGREDSLTSFFGSVAFAANGAAAAYHLLLSPRVLLKCSLTWVVFGMSAFIFMAWAAVYLHFSIATIAVAQGMIYFLVESIAVAHLHTALTLFPSASRGRVRAMTEGFGRPLGTLFLFLVAGLFSFRFNTAQMTALMTGAAILFLFYPLIFRRIYHRHLLRCLDSKDPSLVFNAVQALGENGKKTSLEPLASLLKETKVVALQENIVLSLGRIRSREFFRDLVDLFSTSNAALQSRVLEALCQYNNHEAMFALIKMVKYNPGLSLEGRLNAAMVLTRLSGKRMIPFLLEALIHPQSRIVANAIEALGTLKDRKLISILLPYLDHENHRVRVNAAVALHNFRSTRDLSLAAIERLFRSDQAVERRAALYAIGTLKLGDYEPLLVPMLGSNDKDTRRLACVALAKMENPAFVKVFSDLLLDEDEQCVLETRKRLQQLPPSSRRWVLDFSRSF